MVSGECGEGEVMMLSWRGECHPNTFFYGLDGDNSTSYPVPATPAISAKMEDKSIGFTGLGWFPAHPSEAEVMERIAEIQKEQP